MIKLTNRAKTFKPAADIDNVVNRNGVHLFSLLSKAIVFCYYATMQTTTVVAVAAHNISGMSYSKYAVSMYLLSMRKKLIYGTAVAAVIRELHGVYSHVKYIIIAIIIARNMEKPLSFVGRCNFTVYPAKTKKNADIW